MNRNFPETFSALDLAESWTSRARRSFLSIFAYPNQAQNGELAKILWVVKLRWLAVVFFSVSALPAMMFGFLDRVTLPPYAGVIGILFVFNLLTQLFCSGKDLVIGPLLICFQLAFDLIILSALLLLSRGVENPFVALFLLNAALGGLLIPGSLAWPFLLLIHSLVAGLQWQYYLSFVDLTGAYGWLPTIFVFHILLFTFWLVMRSLGAYLERQSREQIQTRILLERQDRLRAVGALAAGFSHEFASPLNVAKIRLERLARSEESLAKAELHEVNEAIGAIRACEAVIRQMNSSQMDARDFKKNFVRLDEILNDIIDSWKTDHPEVKLNLEMESLAPVEIPPLNFAQVMLNLLDNAYEANPLGEISIRLQKVRGRVQLTIEDQGGGFLPAAFEKLGEPFNTTKSQGTGLGLYVSLLFAESLGGTLKISNRSENDTSSAGACVALDWPLTQGNV